jgi:uncharacterized membrane protein YdfJ with MMPL/SSD domain
VAKKEQKRNKEKQRKKEKTKKPFFERTGEFITKNYKGIFVLWIIILGGAIYPALKLQGVLSYNEMEFLPENLEYNTGEKIYNELFPSNATDLTIIVIQAEQDIPDSPEILYYIQELEKRAMEKYNESIYEIQSLYTMLEELNNTYWNTINEMQPTIQGALEGNITLVNQEMYEGKDQIDALWSEISANYLMTWFNLSRTYYYGVYNSTLFSTGPTAAVYQDIFQATNYTNGLGITAKYVDAVYSNVTALSVDPYQVNDSAIHTLTKKMTNKTLFSYLAASEGLTITEYNEQAYPFLEYYHLNWTTAFTEAITNENNSIVNGTVLVENSYNSSSYSEGYTSQLAVRAVLESINNTAAIGLDKRSIIIAETAALFDIEDLIAELADYLGVSESVLLAEFEPLIEVFLGQIYDLGRNPGVSEVIALAEQFIDEAIEIITEVMPPPETIEDIPSLISRWALSTDQQTTIVTFSYNAFNKTNDEIDRMVEEVDIGIGELAHKLAEELGLENTNIYHTGDKYVMNSWVNLAEEDVRLIDIFTVVFVFVILLVIFCSIVAPLIPLTVIGASIAISFALLYAISFIADIHFMATLFLTVISLGAGVDYCIFIFSRYNEERKKGHAKEQAIITSVKFAGESVFHSGLTVMVGFGAMIIPNFPLLRIVGIAMCIGILISIVSAILVAPTIILLVGDAIWWPKFLQIALRPQKWFKKKEPNHANEEELETRPEGQPRKINKETEEDKEITKQEETFLIKFANFVTKNGLVITLLALVIASPFIYFATTMDTSTDFMGMLPRDFEGTLGRDTLEGELSVGDPTPVKVLFSGLNQSPLSQEVRDETTMLTELLIMGDEHVETIRTTVRPLGLVMPNIMGSPFESYVYDFVGEDSRSFVIEIYLDVSPYNKITEQFIAQLPETINSIVRENDLEILAEGEKYYLGFAQTLYEVKLVTDNSYPIVIPVVIIGVYLVLFFLFGSYFTPIRLILTIALSIVVTLGSLQLIFSVGFGVPIFWLLPLMLFSILMGLGLDYDIFLVTRIKEYYDKGLSNKKAIAYALDHTATIITSCGAVMAAAYSALLLSQLWHVRELGFAFTLAIILDATIIRLVIVPAVMVLMEKWNWMGPKWLMKRRHHCEELSELVGEKEEQTEAAN